MMLRVGMHSLIGWIFDGIFNLIPRLPLKGEGAPSPFRRGVGGGVYDGDAFVHHYLYLEKFSLAGFQVKFGADDLSFLAVVFFVSGGHGLLDSIQYFLFWYFPLFF